MVYTSKRMDLMQINQFWRIPAMVCYTWTVGLYPSSVVQNGTQLLGNMICFRSRVWKEGRNLLSWVWRRKAILNRGYVVDCIYRYGLLVATFVMWSVLRVGVCDVKDVKTAEQILRFWLHSKTVRWWPLTANGRVRSPGYFMWYFCSSDCGAGFPPTLFGFPLLVIIPPLLDTRLSPPPTLCDGPLQAARYHFMSSNLRPGTRLGTEW